MGIHNLPNQITDSLFIGGAQLINASEKIKAMGITSVLKLYESPPDWPPGFIVYNMPHPDGVPISAARIARHIKFITQEIEAGRKVLVVCTAGISRSSTAVLAYLVSTGMSLPDAYQLLKSHHPIANPNPALWRSLIKYFKLRYTLRDVFGWTNKPQNL
ncbi:MAG: dual specificity protein phosphatase family protein [Anaerolineae bacterium]|nr:dual specificity protein phosphatase family protein [Anaerolineae bacterium]